jgi:hypothetical protein
MHSPETKLGTVEKRAGNKPSIISSGDISSFPEIHPDGAGGSPGYA